MTAGFVLASLVVGWMLGRRGSYSRGVRHGQRLTELAHGWIPVLVPGVHRRRMWKVLDRKVPEPTDLVTRRRSPEHPSLPR